MGVSDELEETEKELGDDASLKSTSGFLGVVSSIFLMTFMAEWGDKSQLATIAMGGSRDVMGVVGGAVFGHALCTSLAIYGGRMMSAKISERQVTLFSGLVFLLFAYRAVLAGPEP